MSCLYFHCRILAAFGNSCKNTALEGSSHVELLKQWSYNLRLTPTRIDIIFNL